MLKIIVILFSLIALSDPQMTASSFCNMKNVCPHQTSVACKYVHNPGIRCKTGRLIRVPALKMTVLHNTKRNLIAQGKVRGFKSAVRMGSMKWSPQLEQMAKYNVMRCKYGHDKCHNTDQFKHSGQTIYKASNYKLSVNRLMLKAINNWYRQKNYCTMASCIDTYTKSVMNKAAAFTEMVKYNNNFIGCAAATFTKGRKKILILACNYATTNFVNRATYFSGPTASKCRSGTNINFRGLCSMNEVFTY